MKRGVHSKLFCQQGHSLQGENVYVSRRGARSCRACTLARSTRAYTSLTPKEKQYLLDRQTIRNTGRDVGKYQQEYEDQKGLCAICGRVDPHYRLCSDHDHCCCPDGCEKCARGFLCRKCNQGIGFLLDSPELLRKSAEYIEYWKRVHEDRGDSNLARQTQDRQGVPA